MLVHHGNIEIDSNNSLFLIRKNRESKKNEDVKSTSPSTTNGTDTLDNGTNETKEKNFETPNVRKHKTAIR